VLQCSLIVTVYLLSLGHYYRDVLLTSEPTVELLLSETSTSTISDLSAPKS